jgi:putative GTP pyrophosphokinase
MATPVKEELIEQYKTISPDYKLLCEEIIKQLSVLIKIKKITLATPMDTRIKKWKSILDKIERYGMENIDDISQINDLAGIRIIVLFRRDIGIIEQIIDENLIVHRKENTEERLSENQFGYGSVHYEVSAPDSWTSLPTLTKLKGLKVEIQLRTVSQHTWAASSHVLQYKTEKDVPAPLIRSINRVAALLETVDLEFERLLIERQSYNEVSIETTEEKLNVETLRKVLELYYPKNKDGNEPLSDLLEVLTQFRIETLSELKEFIDEQRDKFEKDEKSQVKIKREQYEETGRVSGTSIERLNKGVFYNYIGVIRMMLKQKFPPKEVDQVYYEVSKKSK